MSLRVVKGVPVSAFGFVVVVAMMLPPPVCDAVSRSLQLVTDLDRRFYRRAIVSNESANPCAGQGGLGRALYCGISIHNAYWVQVDHSYSVVENSHRNHHQDRFGFVLLAWLFGLSASSIPQTARVKPL